MRYFKHTWYRHGIEIWLLREDGKEKCMGCNFSDINVWHIPANINDETLPEMVENDPANWKEITKEEAFVLAL